mgnify:FL=1
MGYIDPIQKLLATSSDRNPLPDGALIRTAKKGDSIDWTVKTLFDSVLAKEKQSRKLGAYERRSNHGV